MDSPCSDSDEIQEYPFIELSEGMKVVLQPKINKSITNQPRFVVCMDTSGSMYNGIKQFSEVLTRVCINMGLNYESKIILVTFDSKVSCRRCSVKEILNITANGCTNFSPVFKSLGDIFEPNESIIMIVVSDGQINDSSQIPTAKEYYYEKCREKNITFRSIIFISYGFSGSTNCEALCPPNGPVPVRRTEQIPGEHLLKIHISSGTGSKNLSPIEFITPGEESTDLSFNLAPFAITYDSLKIANGAIFKEEIVTFSLLKQIVQDLLNFYREHIFMLERKKKTSVQAAIKTFLQIFQNILTASKKLSEDHISTSCNSKIKSGKFSKLFEQIDTIDDYPESLNILNEVIIGEITFLQREKEISKEATKVVTDVDLNKLVQGISREQAKTAAKFGRHRERKKLGPIVEVAINELLKLQNFIEICEHSEELKSVISLSTWYDLAKEYLEIIDFTSLSQLDEEAINTISRYFPLLGWDCDMNPKYMSDTTQVDIKIISSDNTIISTEDKYCRSGRSAKLPCENTGTHQIIPVFNSETFKYLVKNCPRLLQQAFLLLLFGSNKVEETLHVSDPLVGVYGAAVFYICGELCKNNSTVLWEKLKISMDHLSISGLYRYKNAYLHLKTNLDSQMNIKSWIFEINNIGFHFINNHIGIPQFLLHLQLAFEENQFANSDLVKVLQMLCIMTIMKRWINSNMQDLIPKYIDAFLELLGYNKSIFVYPPQLFTRPKLQKPSIILLEDINTEKLDSILGEQRDQILIILQLPLIMENMHKNSQTFQKCSDYNEWTPLILYCLALGIKGFPQLENNVNPTNADYVNDYLNIFIEERFTHDKMKLDLERHKEEMNYMRENIVPMMIKKSVDEFIRIAQTGLKRRIDDNEVVIYKLPDGGPFHDAVIQLIKNNLFDRALALLQGEMTVNDEKHQISQNPQRINRSQKEEYIKVLDSMNNKNEAFLKLYTYIEDVNNGFDYRESNLPNRHSHSGLVPSFNSLGYATIYEYGLDLLEKNQIQNFIKYIKDHETCKCKCSNFMKVHMKNTALNGENFASFLDRMSSNHEWWMKILKPPTTYNINIIEYNFVKFHSWLLRKKFSQADYNTLLDDWLTKNMILSRRRELLKKYPDYMTNVRKNRFVI